MPTDQNSSGDQLISAAEGIDVNEIMASVRKRIEEKKAAGVLKQLEIDEIEEMELLPLPDFLEVPNVYQQHLYPPNTMGDFKPVSVTLENEDATGLKKIPKKTLKVIRRILTPWLRFMSRPLENELKNLLVELHNANKEKLVPLIPIVYQSKEYIKLLHNSMNNTIVELSKLKIEEEMLKTRIKVLEDKLEFLENRERVLEKKLFSL